MKQIIIGLTGTNGAGKNSVVELLVNKYGFEHYSFREFITQEVVRRGLEVNRDNMREVGNDLRLKFGGDYIAKELLKRARESGKNAVIESVRAPMEFDFLQEQEDVTLIAVDAPVDIRYSRIYERGNETDKVTFAEFLEQEKKEMQSLDLTKQNLKYCIEQTPESCQIWNNSSIRYLETRVETILPSIQKIQTA